MRGQCPELPMCCIRSIEPGKLRSAYGLASDTDLSAILGRTLEQVAIGSYQVQLRLDGHVTVSVEGDYSVTGADRIVERFASPPEGAGALVALLGAIVTDAQVIDPRTTTLRFSGEKTIEVYDFCGAASEAMSGWAPRWLPSQI